MAKNELSKSDGNNKLQKSDSKREIARVKKQETKPVPVVKNYLAKVSNVGKDICIKATKSLVKVTGGALIVIGNKLKSIDWKKLLLTFLTELIKANANKYSSADNQTYSYTYTYTQTSNTQNSAPKTNKQEQIKTNYQENKSIEAKKQKQIEGTKAKEIKTNKTTKQIPKQKDNKSINIKQNPLMIEKKEPNKD